MGQIELGTHTMVAEPLRDPAQCRGGRITFIRQSETNVKLQFGCLCYQIEVNEAKTQSMGFGWASLRKILPKI